MRKMQKQPFLVGWGSKKFDDWGGLKNFRTGGLPIWGGGGTFAGGFSTPLHAMNEEWKKDKRNIKLLS